jgi:hypothetical protein
MKYCRWFTVSAFLLLMACAFTGCARGAPPASLHHKQAEPEVPFGEGTPAAGISPTTALVPSVQTLPAGTSITVALIASLSSARSRTGDTFEAKLDEPLVVNGQTVADRGSSVAGRVLLAGSAAEHAPGVLRLRLSAIVMQGTPQAIVTSSYFAKGSTGQSAASSGDSKLSAGRVSPAGLNEGKAERYKGGEDVELPADRRITFRLIEPASLPVRE